MCKPSLAHPAWRSEKPSHFTKFWLKFNGRLWELFFSFQSVWKKTLLVTKGDLTYMEILQYLCVFTILTCSTFSRFSLLSELIMHHQILYASNIFPDIWKTKKKKCSHRCLHVDGHFYILVRILWSPKNYTNLLTLFGVYEEIVVSGAKKLVEF